MVSRGEGLIYWCRTAPLTAIGVVPFGIDDPLAPAELLKVHPHVHLPAQRTLLFLCRLAGWSSSCHSLALLLVVVMPLGSAAPRPGARTGRHSLPVQADVLGVLCCADERRHSLAVRVLPREDHHHDPVSCRVPDSLFLLFPHLRLNLLRPLCGVFLLQPAPEHLCHVEHLPGGGRHHGTGMSSQAAQEQPAVWAVHAGALVSVGVVDVH